MHPFSPPRVGPPLTLPGWIDPGQFLIPIPSSFALAGIDYANGSGVVGILEGALTGALLAIGIFVAMMVTMALLLGPPK